MSAGVPKVQVPDAEAPKPSAPQTGAFSDIIWRFRDRMVSSPVFQRWAVKLPIFSWISSKRASQLFDIGAGFVYSQTLFACVRLKLFDLLAAGPLPVSEIARRAGLPVASADRLAEAAAALQLLQRRGTSASGEAMFGLGVLGASINGNPGYAEIVRHHEMFYADLANPVALLKGEAYPTQLSQYWPYAGDTAQRASLGGKDVTAYTDLMAASQGFVSGDILDAYDMSRHAVLMDVGGGDGTFLRAAAARAPGLRLQLFDLPPVAETARTRFSTAGLGERALCFGGDFQRDALPAGADIISLVRVAHDHDDAVVEGLFARAFAALPPGGVLIVAEPMSGVSGAESMADAYFGFYLMAMGTGRARSPERLKSMLSKVGFAQTRRIPTRRPLMVAVVLAKKAAE